MEYIGCGLLAIGIEPTNIARKTFIRYESVPDGFLRLRKNCNPLYRLGNVAICLIQQRSPPVSNGLFMKRLKR